MRASVLFIFLVAELVATAAAQVSLPLKVLRRRLLLEVAFETPEGDFERHLLVDTAADLELLLHRDFAGGLRDYGAESVVLKIGSFRPGDLEVRAGRVRFLENLTVELQEGLDEKPVVGVLGWRFLSRYGLRLDIPGRRLVLLPHSEGLEPRPAEEGEWRLPLDLRSGLPRVQITYGEERILFELATGQPSSWIDANRIAGQRGSAQGGNPEELKPSVEGHDLGPFLRTRPIADERILRSHPAGVHGGLGVGFLEQFAVEIDPFAGWLYLRALRAASDATEEKSYYAALEQPGAASLEGFLEQFPSGTWSAEAARNLFALRLAERPLDPEHLRRAEQLLCAALPLDEQCEALFQQALELEKMGGEVRAQARSLAEALARRALALAHHAEGREVVFDIRIFLGEAALRRARAARAEARLEQAREARRQLLSAAFGKPTDDRVHLLLGEAYEKMGKLARAESRYVRSLTLAKLPITAFLAWRDLVRKRAESAGKDERAIFTPAYVERWVEGKIPAFHAPEIERDLPAGRNVLLELFTGAQCPPCLGVDLAIDGILEAFPRGRVAVLAWHLPIPAADPLSIDAGKVRQRALGVRGTPSLAVDGLDLSSGGGDADRAAEFFQKLRAKLLRRLASAPAVELDGERVDAGERARIRVRGKVGEGLGELRLHAVVVQNVVVYPGANHVLFHRAVVRSCLSAPQGEDLHLVGGAFEARWELDARALRDAVETEMDIAAGLASDQEVMLFDVQPCEMSLADLAVVVFVRDAQSGEIHACMELEGSGK